MQYNFDEVIDRKNTFSMKWDGGELIKQGGITETFNDDTIPVFTADMDFRCAKPIQEALQKVVDHNIYGYTHFKASKYSEYTDAVVGWFKEQHQWDIDGDDIVYVDGTVHAVKVAIQAFTAPGEGVLINRPIYMPFTAIIEQTKREVVNSQLNNHEGYYTFDFDDLDLKLADENTKLMILCHPHNPTGRVWTPAELRQVADLCEKHDVLLVADEIHSDLLRADQVFHPLETVSDYPGIITCTAVNKTFNLAGLHATNVIIRNPQIKKKYQDELGFLSPNIFTVSAVIAAYTQGHEWLEQVKTYIDGNIDWVLNFLQEKMPLVKCYRPEGTYIMWMDFRAYGLRAEEIHQKIYNQANVVLEGGQMFDPEFGAGFERICIPSRRALIEEVFNRIATQFSIIDKDMNYEERKVTEYI